MTLVQPDHPFVMLHLGFIRCWIFLNFYKCALSSFISLSSKYWRRGGEKNWTLYVEKEEKFSLCQPRGIFYLHFIVSSFWRSVFQRVPVLQSSLLPHYSELLMCWAKFLNAALGNSREFSLVSSSCSFLFIWRVNVCVSWTTLGR